MPISISKPANAGIARRPTASPNATIDRCHDDCGDQQRLA
jgi:hypothetical protein